MAKLTFKGGVHPYEGKELSMDIPAKDLLPGKELVFPLSQHIGAPAKPIVEKGQRVLVGEKIAEAGGFVSANIHSSVSGTVKTIEPRLMSSGAKVNSIVIENDEQYEEIEFKPISGPLSEVSVEELRERIKEAGIVGMGGAGFPTHIKVTPKNIDEIDHVIVNCAECEPYLTSDYRRMIEEGEKIVKGLKVLLRLLPNAKGVLAVENNKPEAIAHFTELVQSEERIEVATLQTKYPQGGERTLIYAVTGREVNSTMLPADVNCVVQNVDTTVAIYRAIFEGKPLYEGMVTITGDAVTNPGNYRVRLGTMASTLVETAGGFQVEPEKIICGGAMMGRAMHTLEVPMHKTFSSVLAMTKDEVAANEPSNCIRCGRCMTVCPGRLVPQKAAVAAAHGDKAAFEKVNGMECCECGCCSYVCPAKRHLTQTIASMRKQILADRKKK